MNRLPSDVAQELGIQPPMLRKYAVLYEEYSGKTIPQSSRKERLYSPEMVEKFKRVRQLMQEQRLGLEEAMRSVAKVIDASSSAPVPGPSGTNDTQLNMLVTEVQNLQAILRENQFDPAAITRLEGRVIGEMEALQQRSGTLEQQNIQLMQMVTQLVQVAQHLHVEMQDLQQQRQLELRTLQGQQQMVFETLRTALEDINTLKNQNQILQEEIQKQNTAIVAVASPVSQHVANPEPMTGLAGLFQSLAYGLWRRKKRR